VALVAVVALTACPPPRVVQQTVAVSVAAADAALTQAEAAFGKRPDVEQVRAAVRAFTDAAAADPARVEGAVGVVRGVAWLIEHGAKEDRAALVDQAVAAGQQCQQRASGTAPCNYWQAVSLGLAARERPLTALGELKGIIELLKRADAQAPTLDDAGPARVLAMLLVRAPGWPVGPGSADDGLLLAQKAVELAPKHPLNHVALAECLAATGETDAAKAAYVKAAELGRARGDVDGSEWATQAEAALKKLGP
jgi:tetratricopeptide (TPR) repeat protein